MDEQPLDHAADPHASTATGPLPWYRRRDVARLVALALAGLLVWLALSLPDDVGATGLIGLARIPVEVLVIIALAAVLPPRVRRVAAVVAGVALAVLVVLKALDAGFIAVFERSFDVIDDWYYLGPAVGVLADSAGRTWAVLAVLAAIAVVLALLLALPASLVAVSGALARHRRRSLTALVVLAVAALVCALTGASVAGVPVAEGQTSQLAWTTLAQVRRDAADHGRFAAAIASDPFANVPGDRLLTALRGKDVLLVFVESYGQVALTNPEIAPTVRGALDSAESDLRSAGVSARSGWLSSPTFGGASWLAHSTVQSGLWVDSQRRYDQLVVTKRLTLTRAFTRAGWRTVTFVPEMTGPWPEGQPFYGFDQLLTGADVGYRGPRYGYALMPDQYIYSAFARRELGPGHPPVMAEIDTLSSHTPWVTPPALVPWGEVGDGSIFRGPAGRSTNTPAPDVRVAYARTVAYAMRTLASFAATADDPNLVILAMGDHQPHTEVSGANANHEVPVMLITRDADVLSAASGWGWTSGLQPSASAPVWQMDQVRDKLLTSFGPPA